MCIRRRRVPRVPPYRGNWVNLETTLLVFGYSSRHFMYLDPSIETHLKKHFIPAEQNILAYLRVDMITNDSSKSNPKFPGFLIFTSDTMYIMKILNEAQGDLSRWLEKFENYRLEDVLSMKAVCFNQGILITCNDQSDESASDNQISYLMLIHERKRTGGFLSFMKKSEILPSERINDTKNPAMPILPQLGEDIVYFLVSEVIVIHQNREEWKRFALPGFAFSKNKLLILQYSEVNNDDETSDKYETDLIIEHERKVSEIVRGYDKKALLVLQFDDEENSITEVWYIKTGLALTHRAIAILNDIWRCYN